jgi:hypothetical protein
LVSGNEINIKYFHVETRRINCGSASYSTFPKTVITPRALQNVEDQNTQCKKSSYSLKTCKVPQQEYHVKAGSADPNAAWLSALRMETRNC